MELIVQRREESDWSVCGDLSINGDFFCFCLEPARDHPIHPGHPCIAAGGPFEVILTMSPHLGYITPEILNVPDRTDIRIHIGNRPVDSLGCTLVGSTLEADWVGNSTLTFMKLMGILKQADKIMITYVDPPEIAG